VEAVVPLLLTAVHDGMLSLEDVTARLSTKPREIFSLPEQPDTWVEIDPDAEWQIDPDGGYSRAGWTPYAGRTVHGRIGRVVLRGRTAYDGTVQAPPGWGRDLRREEP
jgi:carbamoyl-phosphate synthase/aspartate carbamoyltransferase/dihydroorotase